MATYQDDVAYSYENTGVTLTPTKEGSAYSYENTGVTLTPTKEGVAYVFENTSAATSGLEYHLLGGHWGQPMADVHNYQTYSTGRGDDVAYVYENTTA